MSQQLEYASVVQPDSITVHTLTGKAFTWPKSHPAFSKVKEALRARASVADIEALMDVRAHVARAVAGYNNVVVRRDGVYYKDKLIHTSLTERILAHLSESLPVEPLLVFMDNLYQNQRREAVLSLYDFLEANKVPITPDGCFLCYKKVNDAYKDYHTGTFDNSPGTVVKVDPWEVDADRDRTCSKGLHVCSREYLPFYFGGSGHVVICKVNPMHVVAVPRDYNNAKMRVFQYEVIGELTEETKADIFDNQFYVTPNTVLPHTRWHDNWIESSGCSVPDGYEPPTPVDDPDDTDIDKKDFIDVGWWAMLLRGF